jgi:sarcosine oxidase subunit gamma
VPAVTADAEGVRLREEPYPSQIELRLDGAVEVPFALPAAGQVNGSGPRYVLWCGPDWYLVVDSPNTNLEAELQAGLHGGFATVVDVSAARTVLNLSGPNARAVLEHGCMLDLHPRAFGPGRCAQTNLAKAQVLIHQLGTEEYRVFVRSSFADYLARWLLDAMVEYTGDPT